MRSFALIAALCLVASVSASPLFNFGGGGKVEAEASLQLGYNNQGQILCTGTNYSEDRILVEAGLVDQATGGLYLEKLAALIEKAIISATTPLEQKALARLHIMNPHNGQIDVASFAHYGLVIQEDGIYVKGFKKVVGLTKTVASNLRNGTVTIFSGIFNGVKEAATGIWNGIGNAWKGAWNGATTVGSGFVHGIGSFFGAGSKPRPTSGTIQAGGIYNNHVNVVPAQPIQSGAGNVVISGTTGGNAGGVIDGGSATVINGASNVGSNSGIHASLDASKNFAIGGSSGGSSAGIHGSFDVSKNFGIGGSAGGSSPGIHVSFDASKNFGIGGSPGGNAGAISSGAIQAGSAVGNAISNGVHASLDAGKNFAASAAAAIQDGSAAVINGASNAGSNSGINGSFDVSKNFAIGGSSGGSSAGIQGSFDVSKNFGAGISKA